MTSEEDFKNISTKILKAVSEVETNNIHEDTVKLAVLMLLYKSFESEEVFNNNCEILDNAHYEEERLKRFCK